MSAFPVNFEFAPMMESVCGKNDHGSALMIMQVLSSMRRKGYIDTESLVMCLSYCANSFAKHDNDAFFKEFVQYMPNIIHDNPTNPFSAKAKMYYFAHKHGAGIYTELCKAEATENELSWFRQHMVRLGVIRHSQLIPLRDYLRLHDDMSPRDACDRFVLQQGHVPMSIKSGM